MIHFYFIQSVVQKHKMEQVAKVPIYGIKECSTQRTNPNLKQIQCVASSVGKRVRAIHGWFLGCLHTSHTSAN